MERFQTKHPALKKYSAALLVNNEWLFYKDPTIGERRSLRRKGAIIMHLVVERHGNQVESTWVTDSGQPVTVSVRYLTCKEMENL